MHISIHSALAAGLLLGGAGAATPATAAVYQVQFSGHVTTLSDPGGVFGGASAGQAVVATVRIDDGVAGADIRHSIDGYGSQYGVYGSGVARATVQLNGVAFAFAGDNSGALNRVNFLRPGFPSYDGVFTNLSGNASYPYAGTFLQAYATSTTVDFLEQSPFGDFYGSPLDFTTGPSAIPSLGFFRIDFYQGNPTVGNFQVDRIVVSQAGAVPEPATWGMLIAGFGLVGAALRRRQAAIAATV